MISEPTVTIKHIREANLCVHGSRSWLQRHGVDWGTFVRKGMTVAKMRELNDNSCFQVIALAERDFHNDK